MGIVEVLKHLPRLLRLRMDVLARTLAWNPDVVIGIDGPDFNLGLEHHVKAKGPRTGHYVSPSIWTWRENWIIKKISRLHQELRQDASTSAARTVADLIEARR